MAHIDRLFKAIFQYGADSLVMTSGEQLVLLLGEERRTASPKPTTVEQIENLLSEIVPADRPEILGSEGTHNFRYSVSDGPVRVTVIRENGSLRMQAAPAGEDADVLSDPISADASAGTQSVPAPAGAVAGSGKDLAEMEALLRKLVEHDGSDLHLTSDNPPLFRKSGEMVALDETGAFSADKARNLLFSITPGTKRADFEKMHDVDFSYEIHDVARFRCNLFLDRKGVGGVFRVIPAEIATTEQLGIPKQVLSLCDLKKGLVVVTGPTGSGKSTTLASMIDYINRNRAAHIITIEDPIEFVHPSRKCLINQREVGAHTQGFKNALRAALREDPDILLVGEMRDLETVAIAIETAETGHLVFGTLHTNTAPSTVDRIIDQFPADRQNQVRTMLSESLKGVISQTLCRKKEGGRVAIREILLVNSAVSNLIREGKTYQIPSIMQAGKGFGMVTMGDALLDLVKRKVIDVQEAYAHAINKAEFRSVLERNGLKVQAA